MRSHFSMHSIMRKTQIFSLIMTSLFFLIYFSLLSLSPRGQANSHYKVNFTAINLSFHTKIHNHDYFKNLLEKSKIISNIKKDFISCSVPTWMIVRIIQNIWGNDWHFKNSQNSPHSRIWYFQQKWTRHHYHVNSYISIHIFQNIRTIEWASLLSRKLSPRWS